MKFKIYLSKVIALLFSALLFFSFKPSYWEFNKDERNTIYSSISKVFKDQNCSINTIDDTFYTITKYDSIVGYLAVTNAPSKFLTFDYYVLFDNKTEILKVEILHYRENWGAEICSKNWLSNFIHISTDTYSEYSHRIDGISGATISVNSIKRDVFKISNALKKVVLDN